MIITLEDKNKRVVNADIEKHEMENCEFEISLIQHFYPNGYNAKLKDSNFSESGKVICICEKRNAIYILLIFTVSNFACINKGLFVLENNSYDIIEVCVKQKLGEQDFQIYHFTALATN